MSASETVKRSRKSSAAPELSPVELAFAPYRSTLVEEYGEVEASGKVATLARIKFGGTVNLAVHAMLAVEGTSAETAQGMILGALQVGGFHVTSWTTIQDWTAASEVYSDLSESTRDVIAANGGVHALRRLKGVPAKDGKRADFADKLVENGTVTFDGIAAAVKAQRGEDKPKVTPAQKAQKLTEKHADTFGPMVAALRGSAKRAAMVEWSPEVQKAITLAAMIGYRAGHGGKALLPFEKSALSTLSYFGPVADESDGSEADDA